MSVKYLRLPIAENLIVAIFRSPQSSYYSFYCFLCSPAV